MVIEIITLCYCNNVHYIGFYMLIFVANRYKHLGEAKDTFFFYFIQKSIGMNALEYNNPVESNAALP